MKKNLSSLVAFIALGISQLCLTHFAIKEVSPKGLVPALQVGSSSIHDSTIICEYLDEAYISQQPTLLPADPLERATARIWVDYVNKSVVPAYFRLLQAQPNDKKTHHNALTELYAVMGNISKHVKGKFFFGDDFSLVDVAIAPWAVRDFIIRDYRDFKREEVGGRWKQWAEALESRPSVIRTTSVSGSYFDYIFIA